MYFVWKSHCKKEKSCYNIDTYKFERGESMDVTSVASLSLYFSRAQAYSDVGYAVLDMSMDTMKMEGAGVAQMIASAPGMELSVNPSVGGNFDMSV